jgi:hypothetical protein
MAVVMKVGKIKRKAWGNSTPNWPKKKVSREKISWWLKTARLSLSTKKESKLKKKHGWM